ncbi:type III-B CRISPR module-associated protein Cmr5 [Hazenella sp. IB182353]|uniref:type III-B CRISPR module-associated protein Cmr5 n=1 Tax=Polycladospora coralii TaxID=2771432 RepID=UPI001746571A|nr:type III-B CRISPR module-associated protein Cmr5 [Polycladospora coralii]MBS7530238.1 type III-B CRISPR module-associated protein Cmr5 [Polycladospora coralii]
MQTSKTIDQKRAQHALEKIRKMIPCDRDQPKEKEQKEKLGDEYASYVTQLPANMITNGMGQALAQLVAAAKGSKEDAHYLLYENLQNWLCEKYPYSSKYKGKSDLLDAIIQGDQQDYRWAFHEAMSWLEWHKKLATAYLKKTDRK